MRARAATATVIATATATATATAVGLGPLGPAAATAGIGPTPSPTRQAPPALTLTSDKGIVDYGQTHQLTVTGPIGSLAELAGNDRLLRQEILRTGAATWTQRPVRTTAYQVSFADQVGLVGVAGTVVRVRRTVSLALVGADAGVTFYGFLAPQEPGVRVTIARLDSVTRRVAGVASAVSGQGGSFQVSMPLPLGPAGYYALVPSGGGLEGGRSGLHGLDVRQSISLGVSRSSGSTYVFSGGVRNGPDVPVTLARVVHGRPVGVAGGRTDAGGRYAFRLRVAPGTHGFQVLTADARSRAYGLVVPGPPAVSPAPGRR